VTCFTSKEHVAIFEFRITRVIQWPFGEEIGSRVIN